MVARQPKKRRKGSIPTGQLELYHCLLGLVGVFVLILLFLSINTPEPTLVFLRGGKEEGGGGGGRHDDEIDRVQADFVHVVLTRFMQEQPDLLHLGYARFLLFQSVCFPTMIKQTTQNFVWIIQTDPNLHESILDPMVNLLKAHSNIFLVGSNLNLLEYPGGLKAALPVLLQSNKRVFFSGNPLVLQQIRIQVQSAPLVQTRLDADDGLHVEYLAYIQSKLLPLKEGKETFHFWCVKRLVEWYPHSNQLEPVEHSKLCVTPGLTVAVLSNNEDVAVPEYSHDVLYKRLQKDERCIGKHCIDMISEFQLAAIRTRTWTSAGMLDISLESSQFGQRPLWNMVNSFFGVVDLDVSARYLESKQLEIARDNLRGQCTNGHSCKTKSLEQLQRMVEIAEGGAKTVASAHRHG